MTKITGIPRGAASILIPTVDLCVGGFCPFRRRAKTAVWTYGQFGVSTPARIRSVGFASIGGHVS